MTEAHLMCPRDGVRIFLLAVVALSVFVDSVRTGLATTDEVRHGVEVGRFFSLKRGEVPILGWGGAHGRHASLPP
jgi:hypothetical protein